MNLPAIVFGKQQAYLKAPETCLPKGGQLKIIGAIHITVSGDKVASICSEDIIGRMLKLNVNWVVVISAIIRIQAEIVEGEG